MMSSLVLFRQRFRAVAAHAADSAWDVYIRHIENRSAFIMVDSALAQNTPIAIYPNLISCQIEVNSFRENGLPDKKAFEAIYGFEDVATGIAQKSGQNFYAGRYGIGAEVTYHFYATATNTLIRDFEASAALKAITPFICVSHSDPEWKIYFLRLYPTPEERNRIENTKVREQLVKSGDALMTPRTIDHYAYFESIEGLNAFRGAIEREGYKIVEAATVQDDRGLFLLSFTKSQNPAELDPITWTLHGLAQQHKGIYDGWGCPVVRPTK